MLRKYFKTELVQAAKQGKLLTPKHDPNNLGKKKFAKYRTVIAHNLADKLVHFFEFEKYKVNQYRNTNHNHSQEYFEIIPLNSSFSIPTSGVGAFCDYPTEACDRLIAVSGSSQGWHVFGEKSSEIENKKSNGELILEDSFECNQKEDSNLCQSK